MRQPIRVVSLSKPHWFHKSVPVSASYRLISLQPLLFRAQSTTLTGRISSRVSLMRKIDLSSKRQMQSPLLMSPIRIYSQLLIFQHLPSKLSVEALVVDPVATLAVVPVATLVVVPVVILVVVPVAILVATLVLVELSDAFKSIDPTSVSFTSPMICQWCQVFKPVTKFQVLPPAQWLTRLLPTRIL